MTFVAAVAGLIAVLTSWIVGIRLLWLARRTRQTPELLIAGTFILAGGVWNPLFTAGRQGVTLPDDVRAALVALGALAGVAGLTMFLVFNVRVFRPEDRWATVLAGSLALGLVGAFVAQTATGGWVDYAHEERGPWLLASWLAVALYSWSTSEAWLQYRMLVRRCALGLADAVVTDRMRLWTLAMGSALMAVAVLASLQALGIPVAGTQFGLLVTAACSLATSVSLWLAFLPPAAYVARVRAAAAAAGA